MTTLITGGTGFLGRHLVDQLIERGDDDLRVLTRSFDLELADKGVEICEGSLSNAEDVRRAVDGVERVYHLAGKVERDRSKAHRMYEIHVEGTRRLLGALVDQPVDKIVVASTSGTVGVSKDPDDVATDDSPTAEPLVKDWPYYLSKIYAERVCQKFVAEHDLPVVLMRPTLLLGPGDRNQSSTGDVILYLQKKIPGRMSGGLSFVDVRDTAAAFIAAMDKAQPGETYLLGAANMSITDFLGRLEEITGIPAPKVPLPDRASVAGARLLDGAMRLFGKRADVDPVSVEMATHYWYIDWSKATGELGFQPRSTTETLRDTVRWIQKHHPEFTPRQKRRTPPADVVPAETIAYAEKLAEEKG